MSIYIPGMKMPKNCIDCAFGWNGWCHRINSRAFVEVDMRRHDCPLIEIPPHGRLIDADALDKTIEFIGEAEAQIYGSQNWRFAMKCRQALENAPTIIEAEPCNDLAKPNNDPTVIEAEEESNGKT